ncbi:MAG: riboflavin synthase [Leptospiraceae bacterium]|nr:riboflavin synthase [Leptospiraceae bacterium]
MFTGIIETQALLKEKWTSGENTVYRFESNLAAEFRPDESVAHNGVCLTVENADETQNSYQVTAIPETLARSNLGDLVIDDSVNLERAMPVGGRLDGHFVQGHVDTIGTITAVRELDGSHEFDLTYPAEFESLIVYKGSICIDGISLTVARNESNHNRVTVCIIPHTFRKTNASRWQKGTRVNLEFDVLGKYVNKIMQLREAQ